MLVIWFYLCTLIHWLLSISKYFTQRLRLCLFNILGCLVSLCWFVVGRVRAGLNTIRMIYNKQHAYIHIIKESTSVYLEKCNTICFDTSPAFQCRLSGQMTRALAYKSMSPEWDGDDTWSWLAVHSGLEYTLSYRSQSN